jgi:hypothetical protein
MALSRKPSNKPLDAPPLPAEAQPAGSGATPGTPSPAQAGRMGDPVPDSFGAAPVEPELAQTEEDTLLAQEDNEPMVKYNGPFSRREIKAQEWAGAGVGDMPDIVWDRRTEFKVPASVFTEQALQVLRQDGQFEVP